MTLSERVGEHLRGNAVGYLALFIALTGTSYAATKIGPGDIKKNAVLAKHVKDGELTGADVAENGLGGADIDESTLQNVPVLLGDGSVTTVKLADAAVTMPKLADAAVSQEKLAFDPATQSELDAVAGTIAPPANNSLGAAEPPAGDDQIADGSIDTQDLTDGSIVNADVAGGAAIDDAKLGTINDAGKVADSALSSNVALLGGTQTFSGAKTFSTDLDLSLTGNENLNLVSTKSGSEAVAPFVLQFMNNTTSNQQTGMILTNTLGSTGTTETLVQLNNADDQAVGTGLKVESVPPGGTTTGVDVSDADIGTALAVGDNDITAGGTTISAAELTKLNGNPARFVNLPIGSFFNLSAGAAIDFTASDGTAPDFALVGGVPVIEWDDNASGSAADDDYVGATFLVPDDYVSGGDFRLVVGRDSQTLGGTAEVLQCDVSVDGGAFGSPDSVTLFTFGATLQKPLISPAASYSFSDTVTLRCRIGNASFNGTQDDVARVYGAQFIYSASR